MKFDDKLLGDFWYLERYLPWRGDIFLAKTIKTRFLIFSACIRWFRSYLNYVLHVSFLKPDSHLFHRREKSPMGNDKRVSKIMTCFPFLSNCSVAFVQLDLIQSYCSLFLSLYSSIQPFFVQSVCFLLFNLLSILFSLFPATFSHYHSFSLFHSGPLRNSWISS